MKGLKRGQDRGTRRAIIFGLRLVGPGGGDAPEF
jgi:hypothetical protein